MGNIAFIDGQNLHNVTKEGNWEIDPPKFMSYLQQEFAVTSALYLFAFRVSYNKNIYQRLESAGFKLVFREKGIKQSTTSKGNIDTDLVFHVMHNLYNNRDFDKAVIVANDGDYITMIEHLITLNRLEKLVLPRKKTASRKYDNVDAKYKAYLSSNEIKNRLKRN